MKKSFFLFVVLFGYLYTNNLKNQVLATPYPTDMPSDDRDALEKFFQLLIREEVLGYTLFGDKPMSIADFAPPSYRFPYFSKQLILDRGWEAWLRQKDRIPSPYFVLKREILSDGSPHFYLINKRTALKLIRENKDAFEKEPESVLLDLCDPNKQIREVLSSQFQLGLVLGFGKGNAFNFDREHQICSALSGKVLPPLFQVKNIDSLEVSGKQLLRGCPPNKSNFNEEPTDFLIDEYNEIHRSRKAFHESSILDKFDFPQFICWENCQETRQRRESYIETKTKMQKAYQLGSFLDVTLQQWIDPR